jgi:hypothetical protein
MRGEEGPTEVNATEDDTTWDDTRADGGRDGTDVRWVMTPHDRTRRPSQQATGPQAARLDATRCRLAYCG